MMDPELIEDILIFAEMACREEIERRQKIPFVFANVTNLCVQNRIHQSFCTHLFDVCSSERDMKKKIIAIGAVLTAVVGASVIVFVKIGGRSKNGETHT